MSGKKRKVLPFLTAFVSASAISIGAMFCVVTAFSVPVSGWALAGWLIALSAALAFLCGCRHGWIGLLVLAIAAAAAGYFYRLELYAAASVAIEAVSSVYASAFGSLQTVTLTHTAPDTMATAFFVVIGALLSLITAWTVRGQNTLWPAAVCGILPLVLCLIILQSVPAAWAVLLLVGALALLLLTQQLRRASEQAGGTLALALALPLAVLMLGLYAAFPQESYARSAWSESLRPKVNQMVDKLTIFRADASTGQVQFVSPFSPSTLGGRVWDNSVKKADLTRVGPQRLSGRHVMRVYSDTAQTYYLRGCSLGVYEDNKWLAVSDSDYQGARIPEDVFLVSGNYEQKQVRIETDMKSSVYYTPYMLTKLPENAEGVYDAYIKNPLQQTQYAVSVAAGVTMDIPNAAAEGEYRDFVYETYTRLPEELDAFLSETYVDVPAVPFSAAGMSGLGILWYVKELVQQGKTYNLNTPRVPEGEDFAAWFLTESDTGYCVHFATAATLLLRHYGVPARYVTGYLVDAEAGAWTDVTQDDAHAWVEYYRDDFGWLVFDPTPAASAVDDEPDEPARDTQNEPADTNDAKTEESKNSEFSEDKQSSNALNNNEKSNSFEETKKEGETQEKKTAAAWLLTVLWGALALTALIFGWRVAVLSARTANFMRGSSNRRAVHYYRHIALLARLAKAEIPEELEQLAQKARFSQHKLTDGELRQFVEYADLLTQTLLKEAKPLRRAVYRLVYVLQ